LRSDSSNRSDISAAIFGDCSSLHGYCATDELPKFEFAAITIRRECNVDLVMSTYGEIKEASA